MQKMQKARILVSDNNAVHLATQKEFLEAKGYSVVPAETCEKAEEILNKGIVDVAVLDARLNDDDDDKDISGMELAERVALGIPKIIYSRLRDPEAVRDQLLPGAPEVPPGIDFVSKNEGLHALLASVKSALASSDAEAVSQPSRPRNPGLFPNMPLQLMARVVVVLLLLAVASGVMATTNADPHWLYATVALVIFAVCLIGVASD